MTYIPYVYPRWGKGARTPFQDKEFAHRVDYTPKGWIEQMTVNDPIPRCATLRLDRHPTAVAMLRPCGQIAVHIITVSCEDGLHVNTSKMCIECATNIRESRAACPPCFSEHGRVSRLSALVTE